ncbi:ras and EF-hand domain-containing protein homolog isoform X6 [Littorina saxatilis]|uniref:ras and EF-hand domain-containing protein homolog isoform X6 n=1 Tax=Littorina saxatilis TaxID=31220 RepID=UPI0038B6A077
MNDEEHAEGLMTRLLSLNGETHITKDKFIDLSSSLDIRPQELDIIFNALDLNGDGVISMEELRHSFADTRLKEREEEEALMTVGPMPTMQQRMASTRRRRSSVAALMVGMDFSSLSGLCQEQVVELYQRLHTGEHPELLENFESILLGVIKDVRGYQVENERLEKTFKREKEQHDKHLRQLEDEMEQQMQKVEERVRKQEKDRLEQEKAVLRAQLDEEVTTLQLNLKRMQQEGVNKFDQAQESHLLEMKKRLEEIASENRSLKSELTDSHTNLALVRSEMTNFRQQLNEKMHELDMEKETVMDYVREQDNLTRQLHMLQGANKSIIDTNDDLREALGTMKTRLHTRTLSTDSGNSRRSDSPRLSLTQSNINRINSFHSDHGPPTDLPSPSGRPSSAGATPNSSIFEEMSSTRAPLTSRAVGGPSFDDDYVEDIADSGHSTMRDVELDTEIDSVSMDGDVKRHTRRQRRPRPQVMDDEEPDSHDETDTDMHSEIEMRIRRPGSRGSSRSLTRDDSVVSHGSRSSRGSSRRQLPHAPVESIAPTIVRVTKEPERMYKVVLAGDAAVGKSTFIVRLCKGKFVPNLSSTLGVDFQNKVVDVDGHTVALQLWDTAGQERFRSIAKSYFRRADGVLLLYDVTYERSFVNIREWVDAIEESSPKRVPIMLVGNKTDQRQEMMKQGRRVVRYEDGQRVAREIDALFIESSAKDGSHIMEAVIELTRLLRTNEDLEVKTVGMQLQEMRNEKKSSCCGK